MIVTKQMRDAAIELIGPFGFGLIAPDEATAKGLMSIVGDMVPESPAEEQAKADLYACCEQVLGEVSK